jgi:hypothetical protein
MLDAVKQHGTLRWLFGDWLLENGFYRPVSSLSIALDYALYGEAGWGFRLTNWLLMILTVLGAWALVRAYARLVGNPYAEWLALGVGVALSLQQTGLTSVVAKWSAWWFVAMALVGASSVKLWQGRVALNPPTPAPSPPLREGSERVQGRSGGFARRPGDAAPPAGRGTFRRAFT